MLFPSAEHIVFPNIFWPDLSYKTTGWSMETQYINIYQYNCNLLFSQKMSAQKGVKQHLTTKLYVSLFEGEYGRKQLTIEQLLKAQGIWSRRIYLGGLQISAGHRWIKTKQTIDLQNRPQTWCQAEHQSGDSVWKVWHHLSGHKQQSFIQQHSECNAK